MSDDLELPKAVVKRIVKNKLSSLSEGGENHQVNKDALLAFNESTKVFIQYVACLANEHCKKAKRSTLQVDDIFKVLEEIEFGDYIDPLRNALAQKKEAQNLKKKRKTDTEEVGEESTKKQKGENEDEYEETNMQVDEQDGHPNMDIDVQGTSSKQAEVEQLQQEEGEEEENNQPLTQDLIVQNQQTQNDQGQETLEEQNQEPA
eukprot:TRINITY_DN648_c0_g1_i7.p2 TRINITY_DN648_c0_g1~~TRINITY_DN648_c0_g1_i7.p2  ORF type:complete len:204 (-),score=50.16 TRINITY_DN648_c0_g1_i7:253-864(-)